MRELLRDMKLGARQLAGRPGFAVAAIASLALGIGLDTTLFSVVNAVLLKPVAIERPDRLVEVYTGLTAEMPHLTTSYPDYQAIAEGVPAFQSVAAHAFVRGILSGGPGSRPQLVTGEVVTPGYFEVLGVRPALGRGFLPGENVAEGAAPVIVLSHALWQRRFEGRPDVLGQTLQLSGVAYTVVGVAPATFPGTVPGIDAAFWAPVAMVERLSFSGIQSVEDEPPGLPRTARRGTRWLFVKGRLADGRTIEEARAQLATVFARLGSEFPNTNQRAQPSALPASSVRFHPLIDGYLETASAGLMVAVSLVLLVACANVANLLLARGASRRRELAVRAALGASRARLVRQLLAEGLVLSFAGAALGVGLAHVVGRILPTLPQDALPMAVRFDFALDGRVLAFAVVLAVATTLLCALAPAWSASRPDLVPALKSSNDGASRTRRVALRDVLVVGQLAASLVLLVTGALLTRGLLLARSADLGFDARPLSVLGFNLQMNGYDTARATALRTRLLSDLRAMPGVEGVTLASHMPLGADRNMEGVLVPGHHQPKDEPSLVDSVEVDGSYFATVGVPLLEGRTFTAEEAEAGRPVAIVNEVLARRFFPGRSPIGQSMHLNGFDKPAHVIVGVARNHVVRSVGETPLPYLHLPTGPSRRVSMLVRTATPPETALPALRRVVLSHEPDVVFTDETPAREVVAASLMPTRLGAVVLGGFGGLALLLAAVGLYGVIAYSVSQRTREVGVRLALGARPDDVVRLVLAQGSRLALLGLAVGGVLAFGAGKVLQSLLHGVGAFDVAAYAAAAGLLALVAAVANLLPALQAARTDPLRALRTE